MERRKKKEGKEPYLKKETRHWIFAIVSFVLALLFILAPLGSGGIVGKSLYKFVVLFFGWGYFLFPIILFISSFVFFKKIKPSIVTRSAIGIGFLFFSGLALVSLLLDEGGIVGSFLSLLLVKIFDFYATLIILVATFLISLLLTFDTTTPIRRLGKLLMFWKKEEKEDAYYKDDGEDYVESSDEIPLDGDDEGAEVSLDVPLGSGKEDEYEEEDSDEIPQRKERGLSKILPFSGKNKKENLSPISRVHERIPYTPPPLSLLRRDSGKPETGDIRANANIIKRTLQNFGIDVEMDEVSVGPSVTRYALKPAQGVKLSRIVGLQNDLALALAAHPIRIEAPIPGKSLVGIEIPNSLRTTVGLASLLSEPEYQNSSILLPLSMGRSVTGKPYFGNLSKMPHLLVAGATGSGKSVVIHSFISSLLFSNSPENLRFMMIDPKRVELTLYNKIPHLLTPVITTPKKAILALKWAAKEMDRRYDVLESESVRDISSYHKNIVAPAYAESSDKPASSESGKIPSRGSNKKEVSLPERMPYIIIIIDELADIMSAYPRELESAIVRLAQMSRAVGIHLILSTQRPSVNVITGLIKANVPARIAFQVASQTDSRTIIDMGGAEKLLGAGDMLYSSGDMSKPVRLQSAFVTESEIKKVVNFISKQSGGPNFDIDITNVADNKNSLFDAIENGNAQESENEEDDLYEDAREIILESDKASTTFLQRKLRIGYARAARLVDMLEERGVIGPADGSRPREVYGTKKEGYGEESTDDENESR